VQTWYVASAPGPNEWLARVTASGGAWLLTDHLGSVRVVQTLTAGTVLDQIGYDALGNITSQTDPMESGRLLYAGGQFDSVTQTYVYGAREYSPAEERWMQVDPLGLKPGPNPYAYVDNNPINMVDPEGLKGCGQWDVKFTKEVNGEYNYFSANSAGGVDATVIFKADASCCHCEDMRILQIVHQDEKAFWGGWKPLKVPGKYNRSVHFDSNGWAVDTDRAEPWYRGGDTRWRSCAAQITDGPRANILPTRFIALDYAICVKGPDKDALYGETGWGYELNSKGKVTPFYVQFLLQNGEYSTNNEPDPAQFNQLPVVNAWNDNEGNKIPTVKPCSEDGGQK
jgi:RHS repeat-associated protein